MNTSDLATKKLPVNRQRCSYEDFKLQVLEELLGEDYQIIQLFISPADLGLTGASRKRTYIFCAHRTECRYLVDVHEAYQIVCRALKAKISTQPCDYYVASRHHIQAEAMRVAQVRNIPFQPDSRPLVFL